jgi:uncharacterized protein YceH (UPF0502 family)
VDLTEPEIRVLGCLVEKQKLTPDAYPLSLNALRSATNQSTSRDPVVDYDEATIRDALARLYRRRWARLASTSGRASKYRHLLDDALGLPPGELALLTVLMLRGTQTPGELRARTERIHHFADAAAMETALDGLVARELIARLDRRPGQKEERYAHRLSEDLDEEGAMPVVAASPDAAPPQESRLDRLEREVAELKRQVAELLGRE